MAQNKIQGKVKTFLLKVEWKISEVTFVAGHVTPSRSPFEAKVDLKASKIIKLTSEKYPDLTSQKSVNSKT